MRRHYCIECNRRISKDEISLNKKLIDFESDSFYCLHCMAELFNCTTTDLQIKIEEFKEQGCTLFM